MPRTKRGPVDRQAAAFLTAYLKASKLSQAKLGPALELSQQQVSKYCSGKSTIPREVIRKVENLWGSSFADFVKETFAAGNTALPIGESVHLDAEERGQARYADANASVDVPARLALDLLENPADRRAVWELYRELLRRQSRG